MATLADMATHGIPLASSNKIVIILAGPTAVGKTGVGIEMARALGTEIISADSRQCYKELKIGVSQPSPSQLTQVKHHFIATHSIHEEVTAATFEEYALIKTGSLFETHDHVLIVGGTGLYIKAFCEGLDRIPAIDPELRSKINAEYIANGISWLQEELNQKDQEYASRGEMKNPQRMMRALEVMEATGQSILSFRKGEKAERNFRILKLGLELPKETLHLHIHHRVDQMIEAGLVEEARQLLPWQRLNALRTVGYTECFDFLQDKISLPHCISQIKTNTRQYAKRQMTWFKKDQDMRWFSPDQLEKMLGLIAHKS